MSTINFRGRSGVSSTGDTTRMHLSICRSDFRYCANLGTSYQFITAETLYTGHYAHFNGSYNRKAVEENERPRIDSLDPTVARLCEIVIIQ
jgi:hypothetical protein